MSQPAVDETARELGRQAHAASSEALTRLGAHEAACVERMTRIETALRDIWGAVNELRDAGRGEAVTARDARIRLLYWIAGGLGSALLAVLLWALNKGVL